MLKVLFVAPEAHPLIKTGGLGDVCGSLPGALRSLGVDVRLLLPGYYDALPRAGRLRAIARVPLPRLHDSATVLEGRLPGTRVPVWFVDYPPAFGRSGHPYLDEHGAPWYDNAARFAIFSEVAATLARDPTAPGWRPEIVHCHDWHTALVPALLANGGARPATVFTVHNLAYQGVFPATMFASLGLPPELWSMHGLEFHGPLSFIRGGLVHADAITTVSPTYAREIQTPAFGYGFEGLLRARADRLVGILNGIDTRAWNPARDRHLTRTYSVHRFALKAANTRALRKTLDLPARTGVALIGLVGRLVEQKGIDLLLAAWPAVARLPLQLVVLGNGDPYYEDGLRDLSRRYPEQVAVEIGYDEALAHRIEGGADMFLMPSRFEPCGLNQMYSLRYGTPPIARRVGGLADTVIDVTPGTLKDGSATGFVFEEASPQALTHAIERALELLRNRRAWKQLALTGMHQDFSWRKSAGAYLTLYRRVLRERGG